MLKILDVNLEKTGQKHYRNYQLRHFLMQQLQRLEFVMMQNLFIVII